MPEIPREPQWSGFLGEHPELAELAETVTLERQMVLDLLLEAHTVCGVIHALTGVSPVNLTADLGHKAELVAAAVLGEVLDAPDGEMVGPRVDLWEAALDGASRFLRELAGGDGEEGDDA